MPGARAIVKGEIPRNYWIQMQVQMQVCEITKCDFVQCKITEYSCYRDFIRDDDTHANVYFKGMIGRLGDHCLSVGNEYIYPQLCWSIDKQLQWLKEERMRLLRETNDDLHIDYWKLHMFQCETVERDDHWWEINNVQGQLEHCWEHVMHKTLCNCN